jgi:hypothetical protein
VTSGTYGLRLLARPGVRASIVVLLALIAVAYRAVQFATLTRQVQWGYDFSAYWAAAGRLLDGLSPYAAAQMAGPYGPQQQFLYLYPPPLAAAVTPLAALFPGGYGAPAWIWTGIGFAILVGSVLALWRAERIGERFPLLAGRGRWLLVAAALAFPPVIGELVLGNVHLLLLGLLTVAWLGSRRGTTGGEWAAGLAVGVAAVIKVFPALLLLWFVLTRRPRAALATFVGAAVVGVAALPITGLQPWLEFPIVLLNLSAPTNTTDTLAPTVWLAEATGFAAARIVVTAACLLLLVGLSIAARRDLPSSREPTLARSFGAAVLLSLLVAPAMYHHYLAIAVLPFVLGLAAGVRLRWLGLAYLLMWGGQQTALGDSAWIVNRLAPTLGALVLLAALATAAAVPGRARGYRTAAAQTLG